MDKETLEKRKRAMQGQPIESGNIDLTKRPILKNADGSISTIRSMSVNIDGMETLIPTIGDKGEELTSQEAIDLHRKTGKHLGKFRDVESANEYAKKLSREQGKRYLPKK